MIKHLIKFLFCFCILSLVYALSVNAQQTYLPVHFLYGSRPVQEYKFIEKKWFGGKMGGHVGIGIDSNKILNFVHRGNFHLVSSNQNKSGKYIVSTPAQFNSIFGGESNMVKTLTILIPVNSSQLQKLDSLSKVYIDQSPYDYALFGMRCGAGSYEVLSQLGILPRYSNSKTSLKIFYPKILRKELLRQAEENNWPRIRQQGTNRRIWETD
ncbi:MAG: hypothetical protein M3O67_03485 [Bacteroidota bacterium]|nr:hypothetical protein [Bacteroidota bacterium]